MYLKVQYNNSIKNYNLTNEYNKPYIKVSNSILPLTTNTTQGLCIKLYANNTTYRPLEYQSMSTSNTYYTSAIQSNGLSSTTALTRSSTYDTQYYTRSSTSSTVYYTRSSTSGTNYLTIGGLFGTILSRCDTAYDNAGQYGTVTNMKTSYGYCSNTASLATLSGYSYNGQNYRASLTYYSVSIQGGYLATYIHHGYPNNETQVSTITSTNQWIIMSFGNTNFRDDNVYQGNHYYTFYGVSDSIKTIAACSFLQAGQYPRSFTVLQTLSKVYTTQTTGTSYLTRASTSATSYLTRSSTYSTIYLTRSSTSGYSGVSSSSSQSSGWL